MLTWGPEFSMWCGCLKMKEFLIVLLLSSSSLWGNILPFLLWSSEHAMSQILPWFQGNRQVGGVLDINLLPNSPQKPTLNCYVLNAKVESGLWTRILSQTNVVWGRKSCPGHMGLLGLSDRWPKRSYLSSGSHILRQGLSTSYLFGKPPREHSEGEGKWGGGRQINGASVSELPLRVMAPSGALLEDWTEYTSEFSHWKERKQRYLSFNSWPSPDRACSWVNSGIFRLPCYLSSL